MQYNYINLVQYNVNKSRAKVMIHLFHKLDPSIHHVIAIQEPWINPHTKITTSHTDPRYQLCIPNSNRPRTALYISKKLKASDWTWDYGTDDHGDVVSLHLQTYLGTVHIHNAYNLLPMSHSDRTLGTIALLEERLEAEGQYVLLGDFNLYHPR